MSSPPATRSPARSGRSARRWSTTRSGNRRSHATVRRNGKAIASLKRQSPSLSPTEAATTASIGERSMTSITGGCHCGAIRYQIEGEAIVHALCHCTDCRRHAGAPMVGWSMYAENALKVTKGTPKVYQSSEHGRRQFCADCGTGLFYTNANVLPGIVDIQSATYDDPDAVPAMVHIQTAERIRWMERAHELPTFERYPPQP